MTERTAAHRALFGVTWALCAALLLCAGFAAVVVVGAILAAARAGPDAASGATHAFGIYAAVVLLKGLLPALAAALLLWAVLDRVARVRERGRIAVALGLFAAAALACVAAAGLLLPLPSRGIGSVHYTGVGNFVRTCAEMAVPVALALWIPRALLPASRRRLAFVLAGIAVLFVATSAIARYALRSGPAAAPVTSAPAAAQTASETAAPADVEPAPSEAAPGSESASDEAIAALGVPPGVLEVLRNGAGEPPEVGWEERQRRRETAERIRALIEKGPDATSPPVIEGVLAEGAPTPVYRDGELIGVAFQDVPPDGFYAQLGFRDGDVVESINGVPLAAPDAAGALLTAVLGSEPIEVTVERDGAAEQIAVPLERVLEGLRALDPAGSSDQPKP